ncbi:hypothetical protein [Streptomyces sp. NPDC054842]
MHAVAVDWPSDHGLRADTVSRDGPTPEHGTRHVPLTWRTLQLETMASLLVVSLRRLGSRCFAARCQWPRLHPLNERCLTAVAHHPLIMAESTRQLAVALAADITGADGAPLQPVSVSLGLDPRLWPTEEGGATDVSARLVVSDLASEDGALTAYRVTAEFVHAGTPFGSCSMRLTRPGSEAVSLDGADGSPALLYPAAPAVGAATDADVMLARAPRGRLVIAPRDPCHPLLIGGRNGTLPVPALMEAGRQAALLRSGYTAAAVVGLRGDLHAPVPTRGTEIEVASEPGGIRFLVSAGGRTAATGAVSLLRP